MNNLIVSFCYFEYLRRCLNLLNFYFDLLPEIQLIGCNNLLDHSLCYFCDPYGVSWVHGLT